MPEGIGELLAALGPDALATAAEAAPAAVEAAPAAFGAGELAAAGLPFAAGAGELGSVATGLGEAGVSAFGDTAAIASALGGAGAAALPLGAELASAGLPAAAGIGEVGAVSNPASVADALLGLGASSGTGVDLTSLAAGGLTGANASLSQPTPVGPDVVSTPPQPTGPPQPTSFSGTTSVGPSSGTPAGALNSAGFETAQTGIGGQAPGGASAVNPVGAAGSASGDLTTSAAKSGSESFLDKMVTGAGKSIQNNWLPAAIGAGALGYNVLKGNQQQPGKEALAALPAANANLAATALGQIPGVTDIHDKATGAAGTAIGQGSGLVDKGTGFTNYLPTATLPPDMQSALDSATSAAKTKIISGHASRGLPTDPKKNSVLAQELAQADRDSLATKAQMESQLLTSGTQLIGAGNQTTGTGNSLFGTGLNATQVTNQLVGTGLNATGLSADIYNKLVGLDNADRKAISDAVANFAKALGGTGGGLSLKLA